MRVIALLLSPRYQLVSEATPRKIIGTEGTIKVLLPKYQVYKCFIPSTFFHINNILQLSMYHCMTYIQSNSNFYPCRVSDIIEGKSLFFVYIGVPVAQGLGASEKKKNKKILYNTTRGRTHLLPIF